MSEKRFFTRERTDDDGESADYEGYEELVDRESGEVVFTDGGEPEDNLLRRDNRVFVGLLNSLADQLAATKAQLEAAVGK